MESSKSVQSEKLLKNLKPSRILLPVLIGLSAGVFMLISSVKADDVMEHLHTANPGWLLASLGVLLLTDAGYVCRLKYIAGKDLGWKSCMYVVALWEFTNAVSPPFIGATAVAVFLIHKEGVTPGKAFAFVMLDAFLDDLFFISIPLIAIAASDGEIFPKVSDSVFNQGLKPGFWLSYGLYALYALFFATGLFLRPRAFKWLLAVITSVRFLKKFQRSAIYNGNEIIAASEALKGKRWYYWTTAAVITLCVWSARYGVLNCVLDAFASLSMADHLLIFGRHLVLWLVMMVAPTPGSSGIAELIFPAFFGDFLGGDFSVAVGLLWRMITYYPYLFLGIVLLPRWLRRVLSKKS